jgi:hypothetical protein
MDAPARIGRTARLLEARLEELAMVSEHSLEGERPFDRQILGVEAATRHAVALELLSPEQADAIWAGVARRHPTARWCHAWAQQAA